MSLINDHLISDSFKSKVVYASKFLLIIFFLSPIFSMVAYLIVNNYSGEYVSTYSLAPSDVFYYIMRFVGALGLLLTLLFVYSLFFRRRGVHNLKLIIVFCLLIFWILICDLLAEDRSISFFGAVYREEGFITILSYAGIMGISCITLSMKDNIKFFFRTITIISSIISILIFLQSCRVYIPFFESGDYKHFFMGPFYHFNHYGYYLTMTIMINVALFYMEKKKIIKSLLIASFVLQSYSLVLCYTFGCFLAVLFGLLCFIIFKWIRNGKPQLVDFSFLIILFAVALLVTLTPYESVFADFLRLTKDVEDIASGKEADHAGNARWMLWKNSFKSIAKHPIFGIGSDMSTAEMFNNNCDRPHNEFIQYALFYGIPGFIMYFSLLCMILFPCLIKVKKISFDRFSCFIVTLAYLFSSLFGNTTYYITPIFLFFLIGCISLNNSNSDESFEKEDVSNTEKGVNCQDNQQIKTTD